MSYHLYTTLGIVLEGRELGEADKYYYIFTKDLGLVMASAKSVRQSQSKLRGALDDFAFSELSFIRGKHSWKIVNARDIENLYRAFDKKEVRDVVLRMFVLLRKLVQGEEKHEELFVFASDMLQFLKTEKLNAEELRAFECVAYLRMLTELGYVKRNEIYSFLIETNVWSQFLVHDAVPYIVHMRKEIDASLEASQL